MRPVPRLQYFCKGPSMTKQSEAAACDVNFIMKRYEKSGLLPHVPGYYADVSAPVSYQDARNMVIQADASFQALPASIRSRFSNDPGLFLAAVSDPDRVDELVDLGVLSKPPVAAGGTPAASGGSPAPVVPSKAPDVSAG